MPASKPDPDDEVTLNDLGERPPLEPKPEWTVQQSITLKRLEEMVRDTMRNRPNRR